MSAEQQRLDRRTARTATLTWRHVRSWIVTTAIIIIIIMVTVPQAQVSGPLSEDLSLATRIAADARTINLRVGRSAVLDLESPITRVSLTTPEIADALVTSPSQVLIHGKAPGTISLFVWERMGAIRTYEVVVKRDLTALVDRMRQLFPGEPVTVAGNGADVVISGTVSSKYVVEKAAAVAAGYVESADHVVNLLRQQEGTASNQILLRVRFAEVSRSALQELGVSFFTGLAGHKDYVGRLTTQQFAAPEFDNDEGLVFSDFLNLFLFNTKEQIGGVVNALQSRGLFQSLAEPNLIALNGKEASFLAGGEFPFPIVQGTGGGTAVTIQWKEFGIRLSFTPTILNDDLIHLKVRPEVSSLDFSNGLTLQGFQIPSLTTRRAETEIELRDGQTFAIAGLLSNTVTETMRKIPGIGDIPILGLLFRSRAKQKEQTELVVMITPQILRTGSIGAAPTLPSLAQPFLDPLDEPIPPPPPHVPQVSRADEPGGRLELTSAATPLSPVFQARPSQARPGATAPVHGAGSVEDPAEAVRVARARLRQLEAAEEQAQAQVKQDAEAAKEAGKRDAEAAKVAAKQAERDRKAAEKLAQVEAKRDVEAAKVAAKQAERDRKAAEMLAQVQAKQDAEAAKVAAKQAERDRKAAEKLARAQAKRDAEAAKQAAKDAERQQQVAAKQAEQDRKAAEKLAQVEAKRDAEAAKQAAKDAERQQQVAAKQAEQDRKAAEKLAQVEAKRDAEAAKVAAKQAERDRKAAEKLARAQAKWDAEAAKQAAKDAERRQQVAAKQAEQDRKAAEKLARAQAKRDAEVAKLATADAAKQAERDRKAAEKLARAQAKQDAEAAKLAAEEAERKWRVTRLLAGERVKREARLAAVEHHSPLSSEAPSAGAETESKDVRRAKAAAHELAEAEATLEAANEAYMRELQQIKALNEALVSQETADAEPGDAMAIGLVFVPRDGAKEPTGQRK